MELRHPPTVAGVVLLERDANYRMVVTVVMVAIYAVVVFWMISTIGEPYQLIVDEIRRKRKENPGTDSEEEPMLPSEWLPSAFAVAAMFLAVIAHALSYMLGYWLPWFDARANYKPGKKIRPGSFLMFTPLQNRGRPGIVQITMSEKAEKLIAVFGRLTYEVVDEDAEVRPGEELEGPSTAPIARVLNCPDDWKFSKYYEHRGLEEAEVPKLREIYGDNKFDIPVPPYLQLLKEQLLSPLAMFQLFCSFLWCLDTYWKYTLMQLSTIIGFDAMTAFQRSKTLQTLRGMVTESSLVYVYRSGAWKQVISSELCPGDLFSLKMQHLSDKEIEEQGDKPPQTIPCDALIVAGAAVVNEATLTGESVPQMKDQIPNDDRVLTATDRTGTIYSGTTLVSVTPLKREGFPEPPDQGLLCFALRTGFFSAQGELMRMIEVSQDKVTGDTKETLMALGILLFFALSSAAYVMHKGLQQGDRSRYDLVLRCVMIITSVVPPSLPLQMAFAVNQALISLTRKRVFCTEPFRVPYAGNVDVALFDKTGTLTTDSLIPSGILCSAPKLAAGMKVTCGKEHTIGTLKQKKGDAWDVEVDSTVKSVKEAELQVKHILPHLTPVLEAPADVSAVLAGCHSLIEVDGELIGDPIELTAFEALEYTWNNDTSTAVRGTVPALNKKIEDAKKELEKLEKARNEAFNKQFTPFQLEEQARFNKIIKDSEAKIKTQKEQKAVSVKILTRHHFQSELQRMSTVVEVTEGEGGKPQKMGLVKGSPEALKTLLVQTPDWYDSAYVGLAEEGIRVLALASRKMSGSGAQREEVEKDLTFAGFIAFRCLMRADSRLVIEALNHCCVKTVMCTGDATLTAAHVAEDVSLSAKKPMLNLVVKDGKAEWLPARRADKPAADPTAEIPELVKSHVLLVNEDAWLSLAEKKPEVWKHCGQITVWARCSPQGKANLVRELNTQGRRTLMCGDGGNDVGALKAASVGIALLSGFGNTNTKEEEDLGAAYPDDPELALEKLEERIQLKAKIATKRAQNKNASKRNEVANKTKENFEAIIKKKQEEGGDMGFMAQMQSVYGVVMQQRNDLVKEQKQATAKHGSSVAAGAANFANILDSPDGEAGMDGGTPMVRLGDASVAAPFTYWTPSIACVLTILRQGRCTILSTLQQSQIMMLECIVNAYSLACLSLHGVRSSEKQMMATGMLMTVASISFSYATPINRLHPVRPHRSLFHPAIFCSTMLQVAIHLGCMVYGVKMAEEYMGEKELKEVTAFFKKLKQEGPPEDLDASEDPWAVLEWIKAAPYKPNLLNTVTFLVGSAQEIAVLLVNYKGQPWMKGATENHALCLTLGSLCIGVTILTFTVYPELNALLDMEPFPNDEFKYKVIFLVFMSLLGSFIVDRLCVAIFSRDIFYAQMQQFALLRPQHLFTPLMTVLKILGGLWVLGSGNLLLAGLAYWQYRKYQQSQEQQAEEALKKATPKPVGNQ
jgi:cation-transporting ATPase 13A1